MSLLEEAKQILFETNATCVSLKENQNYQSFKKGIAPILDELEEDDSFFEQASVADKVIGKSAAMLLIKGRIKELYAAVISEYAIAVLEKHHISFSYGEKVPYISNRTKTDMCPMEKSVLETDDIETAYQILRQKLQEMKASASTMK